GGYVAIDFAITHAATTAGLIVAAAAPGGYQASEELQKRWGAIFQAGRENAERGIRLLLADPQVGFERLSGADREIVARMFNENARSFQRDPALVKMVQPQAIERLGEITAPTLVIAGELDDPDLLAAASMLE